MLILRVLSATIDVDNAVRDLNASTLNPTPGRAFYTREELAPLMANQDKNDAFIRLISLTSRKGSKVPLPTVQWVLGMNRQLALSKRIDTHLERKLWFIFAKESARRALHGPSAETIRDLQALIRTLWSHFTGP
jgi:hypothetical protein